MGEIAEMMLDGTLDCETGEYIGTGEGFPRTAQRHMDGWGRPSRRNVQCPMCDKKLKGFYGLHQHLRDKHKIDKKRHREALLAKEKKGPL